MNPSRIAAGLSLAAMIMLATETSAQTIPSRNISLEAAKKVVAEAVKYAFAFVYAE